MTHPTLWCH